MVAIIIVSTILFIDIIACLIVGGGNRFDEYNDVK